MNLALLVPIADRWRQRRPAQIRVDHGRDIVVDRDSLALLDLHQDVERRRGLPLEDGFLGATPARLFIA